jgi:RNA polymerase sigma-70 factor (ECF subfamily)
MLRSMLTISETQRPAEKDEVEGGIGAFDALFHKHWPLVFRVTLRILGDPDEAEDLSLEVFWRLYRRLQGDTKVSEIRNLRAWLFRSATNSALNELRSQKRRAHYEIQAGVLAHAEDSTENPIEDIERVEERVRVREVLAGMKMRDAQLLLLRYTGFSYKEVAEALDIAVGSVGTLLARAEKAFEDRYRELEGK